jgi:hypothetical protein
MVGHAVSATYRRLTFVCTTCARGLWVVRAGLTLAPRCTKCGAVMAERGGSVAVVEL